MQSFGWGKDSSVRDWLFAEGYRFEFFQALRLLEQIAGSEANHQDGIHGRYPSSSARILPGMRNPLASLRLRSQISFTFPASEISTIRLTSAKPFAAELVTPLMCLGGSRGPLPDSFSEMILQRLKERDSGLREFLDIFHHRLLTLLYQAQRRHRLWLSDTRPEESKFANYLFSFAGVGVGKPEARKSTGLPERSFLAYAGLLWQQPRSASGLERILADCFKVSIKIHQLRGQWSTIEAEDQTRIGRLGTNQVLGSSALLGKRFWNPPSGFDIEAGPLTAAQFEKLLPGSTSFEHLCCLTRFYAGDHLHFRVKLRLKPHQAPSLRLGKARLGWTSWLKSKASSKEKTLVLKQA